MKDDYKHNLVKPIARVIVTHGGKVLFLKRSSDEQRPDVWEVPGGAVNEGESYEEGARREVKEEAGIDVKKLTFDHSSSYHYGGVDRISVVFVAEVEQTAVKLSPEHSDFIWVDKDNYHNIQVEDAYKYYFGNYFLTEVSDDAFKENDEKSTSKYESLIVYTDGGSRGNPGPSASGYVIMDENEQIIREGGEYLGITTNNQAEYQAVRTALEECIDIGAHKLAFFIDSQLVVNQLNGQWKIKNRDLWPIHEQIKQLAVKFKEVSYTHVRREHNTLADAKVNEVLDNHSNGS